MQEQEPLGTRVKMSLEVRVKAILRRITLQAGQQNGDLTPNSLEWRALTLVLCAGLGA